MTQGLSNSAIAERLVLAPVSVEKHISNLLAKLDLPLTNDTHRRVQAVLSYLNARPDCPCLPLQTSLQSSLLAMERLTKVTSGIRRWGRNLASPAVAVGLRGVIRR